jgi:hypothetical protein
MSPLDSPAVSLGRRTPRSGGGANIQPRAARVGVGTTRYTEPLDGFRNVCLHVEFATRRETVVRYALVLTAELDGGVQTIRVYDSAHGCNEMHRYTRRLGKQPGEIFHRGTLGEGMRTAIKAIEQGHQEMIEAWQRR